MSRIVYKYHLPWGDYSKVNMPLGAELLFVGVQDERLFVWARHGVPRPGSVEEVRRFRIAGTGRQAEGEFLGTVMLQGGALVFHVFEVQA